MLHPMGWDAFGLPAEQFAIKTGIHPATTTQKSIANFKRQLHALGFSFDWSKEISTCDPSFYKWTQFLFLKLFEKGLAYQKEVPVNWCPALRTVLANEEVVDGKSERGGHPVVRVPMKQWMLKITDYAERLLEGLDNLDWSERTKDGQRNWIGKSVGAEVHFKIVGTKKTLNVFTTRPDTLFGATFMVLAPEHPLVAEITTSAQLAIVEDYKKSAASKSEVDRQTAKTKSGVFVGSYALNPLTHQQIPIWIADYVLMDYGTGAIMAVPAHDERDFEFATQYQLPIQRVIAGGELPYTSEGTLCNSDGFDGTSSTEAIEKITHFLESEGIGKKRVQYKLRDWLFSRQRYWGEPFPIIKKPDGELVGVPPNELPVVLPDVKDFQPSEDGKAPLSKAVDWINYDSNGLQGQRETDTMPGSAGSSWYFLRYIDPNNNFAPFSPEAQSYWMPVDLYLGGAEHTVGHLLYARFWQKVLFDCGLVSHDEPFKKLVHQGMLLGEDGEKMSKSRGNVINPDEIVKEFGADSLRTYLMFMGPLEKDKPWSTSGLEGVRRFLNRIWRAMFDEQGNPLFKDEPLSADLQKALHKTIKKVTEDIERLNFNTAISQMMILVNELYKTDARPRELFKVLSQLLMPFAPHLAEELWSRLGESGLVSIAPWPKWHPDFVTEDEVEIGVQVLGKMRGTLRVSLDTTEEEVVKKALEIQAVTNAVGAKPLKKVIYKPGKILNLIV